jgi:hypothetical protein
VITADEGLRGGRKVPLKPTSTSRARERAARGQAMLVVKRTGGESPWDGRDIWYHEATDGCAGGEPEEMNAEDPLFILYTSGSTGSPRACCTPPAATCLRRDDAPVCLRLPRRRYLLVHRRCRLGHRPQLHRLRAAGQRRDHADVRGRADLSGCRPLLGRGATSTRSTSSTPRRPPSAR